MRIAVDGGNTDTTIGLFDTTCGDLGTATTFNCITADGVFLVVVIMPKDERRRRHSRVAHTEAGGDRTNPSPEGARHEHRSKDGEALPSRQALPFTCCHFVQLNVDSAAANAL